VRRVEPVAVDRVRFAAVEVDVAGVADLGALRSILQREAEAVRDTAGERGVVLRVVVRGRGPVHADLRCAGGIDGLVADLRAEFEGERPFVWWESVRDHTRPELDLEAIRGRDDFSAALIERAEALIGPEGDPARFVAQRVLGEAPRKAAVLAEETSAADAGALIDEARALALGLLEEEAAACT